MSFFASFAFMFGIGLVLMGLMASWLFRLTSAPLWMRIAIPVLTVIICGGMPFAVSSMMGFPMNTVIALLPERVVLVSFVPDDVNHRVDLWLRADGEPPRSYEVELTSDMKKTLREAQERQAHGQGVMLVRKGHAGRAGGNGQNDSQDDEVSYTIDELQLPPKGDN